MNALVEAAGQAPERMSDRELSLAILRLGTAFPEGVERSGANSGREALRNGARAIMQLWHDIDREERLLYDMQKIERRPEHA